MSLPLLVPVRQPVDEVWYQRLQSSAAVLSELWAYLGPTDEVLRRSFETFVASGYHEAPSLCPDGSLTERIETDVKSLRSLCDEIAGSTAESWIKEAYESRIKELLANADLYQAACLADSERFVAVNQELYGLPDESIFWACIAWLSQRTQAAPVVKDAFASFLTKLHRVEKGDANILRPPEHVFLRQRELHMGENGFYGQLFAGMVLPTASVDVEYGDKLVRQLLQNISADDYEIVDSTDGYWSVRASRKQVARPAVYEINAEEFLGTVGHEVGSHLLERINGGRQPLRLLGSGLEHYERGNEGRALIREQVVYDSWRSFELQPRWFEVVCRYVAIALAAGVDGKKRDFYEVFEMMMRIMEAYAISQGGLGNVPRRTIALQAWRLVTRALKGSSDRGAAYYKDMVYLQGNIACWKTAVDDESAVCWGDRGKITIADRTQLELIRLFA